MEDGSDENAIDDINKVLRLEEEQPVGRQHGPDAIGHLAQIVGVREYVEGADDMGSPVFLADAACKIERHQGGDSWNAGIVRALGDFLGRIDAQHPIARLFERDEQRAVVAPNVDHQRSGRRPALLHDAIGHLLEMLRHAFGVAGIVRVSLP